MNNRKYWENRTVWNTYDQMEDAERTADEIAKIYRKASLWLSDEAQDIFEKYVTKHKLSEMDALNLMNTMQDKASIQELLQKLRSGDQSQNKKKLLAELEAPAYRARMERLQNLQGQVEQVMQNIYHVEKDISTEFYVRLAEEAYYKTIFETQKRTGLAFNFSHLDNKQIDHVLSMDWSGQNYSKRIWNNTDRLAQTLKEELVVNLITGRTEREVSEQIALRFGQGSRQARRLVRTESSFISGELTAAAYKECGIEEYRYLATLDLKTSEICRELDGKIFAVSERQVGKNYPPMHPWCRSTTISIVDEETLSRLQRRARDPVTGKTYMVPANMTYKEWYQKYVMNGHESIPNIKISEAGLKRYTRDEIQEFANQTEALIDKYVSKKSRWSGKIIVDDTAEMYGKLWSCDIATMSETSPHIILHEQLHARSISYYDVDIYMEHWKVEEATVQFLAQEISKAEGLEIIESQYDGMADALRDINGKIQISGNDMDFAVKLIQVDVTKRLDWIESKVYESAMSSGTIAEYEEVAELLERLR